jgi:hypothetical protein
VCRSVGLSVGRLVSQLDQSVIGLVDRSDERSVSQSVGWLVLSVSCLVCKSVSCFFLSVVRSVRWSVGLSISRLVGWSVIGWLVLYIISTLYDHMQAISSLTVVM